MFVLMINKLKKYIKDKYKLKVNIDDASLEYYIWIVRLFDQIEKTPGHIAEIGVASGNNSLLFGKLIKIYGQKSIRMYFGFDTFDGFNSRDLNENKHLSKEHWKNSKMSFKSVSKRLAHNHLQENCKLIQGDASKTVPEFLANYTCKNFQAGYSKFALLYIDCNAYTPAYSSMEAFLPYMSKGAIICIDEKVQGSETKALLDFSKKHGFQPFRKSSQDVPIQITI